MVLWLFTGIVAVLLGYGLWRLAAFVARKLTQAVSHSETRR